MSRLYNQKSVGAGKFVLGSKAVQDFTYKGFDSNTNKNNFKLYDIDLVKQDIINHFYIRKGEKLQNPDFGTIIWDILFEPFTDEVKRLISKDVEAIINYDPRISVNSVTIDSTEQGIRIEADITYLPFNILEKMSFNFDRNNSIIN
jgi:phage baseplate assembly protein W